MRIGPYTVERELGRGGMGTVYLARAGDESPVALKLIHPQLALDPQIAARFQAEGDALERLSHANLIGLRARGSSPQGPWLAMDYVRGQTLDERLKARGPLSNLEARELLLSVCGGLAFAHAAGVLHRDLKPQNVLLRAADGAPLVLDFGLALPLDVSQHLTRTGEILGSPGYLAPEQCGAAGETSAATDVYALGGLLYAALTGRPPFQGATLVATLDAALNTPPRDPRVWVPSVDPALAEVCLRCLAKDPRERFGSVAELMDALEAGGAQARSGLGPRGLGAVLIVALALVAGVGLGLRAPSAPAPSVPTPSVLVTPTPQGARGSRAALAKAQAALSAEDWSGVHAALANAEGPEALWLSYLALSLELRAKGEAGEGWSGQREAALERAERGAAAARAGEERVWLEALCALLGAIRYPFAVDVTPTEELAERAARLEGAQSLTSLTDEHRRELARALAQLELKRFGRSEGDRSVGRAEGALRRWRALGGDEWAIELVAADLALVRGRFAEACRALDRADLAAGSARPWRRLVGYYLREVLTQSPLQAPPPAQLRLSQHILAATDAPQLLRARVAISYARSLVDAGRWQEALLILEAHPAPALDPRLRASHQETQAYARLRGGDPAAARALLVGGEEGLRSPWAQTILAIVHLRLGDSARGRAALRGLARAVQDPEGQLLVLEAAVLAGDEGRWRRLLEGMTRRDDRIFDLRAQEALERALRARGAGGVSVAPAPEPARQAATALRARSLRDPAALVAALLEDGRWRRALRWIQEELGEGAAKPQPQLALRLAFRSLERGRDEDPAATHEWREFRRLATRFGERTLGESAAERGLLALLELSGDPPPERLAELEAALATALGEESWEELHEGYLRALTLRLVLGGASPGERQRLTSAAVTAWVRDHESPIAVYTHLQHVPSQRREEVLLSLSRQRQDRVVALLAQRDRIIDAVRAEQIAPREGAERLVYLATDRVVLAGERRRFLLRASELWLMVPGFAREALVCLERIEPRCGPTPPDLVRRLELARSKAWAELPRGKSEALAAAERALAAAGEAPAARAPILAHLGRLECELGQREAGLERLRQALALTRVPEIWLELARVTEGQEQRDSYLQTLGYPTPQGSARHLLREIEAAGHDPVALSAEALRLLEARGQAPASMSLASASADLYRTPASAHLVCQAYLVSSMMTPDALPGLRRFAGLIEAALLRLEPKARSLFEATLGLLQVRSRSFGDDKQHAAAISAALARVQVAAEASPEDAAAFRYRLTQLSAYQHLALLAPAAEERALEQARAREALEAWVTEPDSDLRAPAWLAHLQQQDGDYAEALATLEAGLAKASEFPAQTGRLELARAVVLTHLDRGPEALEALELSRVAGGPLVAGPDSLSLRAEVQLSLGDLEGASLSLSHARRMRVAIQPPVAFGLVLLEARLLSERGDLAGARRKLESVRGSAAGSGISPRGRAQFETLDGDLARRGGDLAGARASVERALELAPLAAAARLAEVDLVVAERGRKAGELRAKELAELEGLSPFAKRRLEERAQELAEAD